MASYFMPSFLTGWDLSSVSAFSLSANLQKRILSYLLKRTLGHLVDGGQLDLAQIDAGIGSGRIEVRNVRLDAEAINRRLPSLPIAFADGQIGNILIQLPVPNFWSGELSITISDISVFVRPRPQDAQQSSEAVQDLSASFASAASQLFVEDEEAQDIEQSIHEALDPEEIRQAQSDSAEEKGSLIATYVEALLTRLKVAITRVQVHLQSDSVDLSFKLDSAHIQSSNTRTEQTGQRDGHEPEHLAGTNEQTSPLRRLYSETRRTLELKGFEVSLQDDRKQAESQDQDSSSSSDDSFDDEASGSPEGSRAMFHSIASLRESSASLYESAIGGSALEEAPSGAKSAAHFPPAQRLRHVLFSLGQEPVVITYKTIKERHEASPSDTTSRRTVQRLVSIKTDIDVGIGNAGAVVLIDHLSFLMTLLRDLGQARPQTEASQGNQQGRAQPRATSSRSSIQRSLALSCRVSSFNLIIGYDDLAVLPASQSSLEAFWARPSRSHPNFGHLRLRCDKLAAHFSNAAADSKSTQMQPQVKITVEDLGLFEHLGPDLYGQCPPEASRVLPVLILDPYLAQSGAFSSQPAKQPQHDYASSTVDVFDWRYNGPRVPAAHCDAIANDNPSSPKAARFTTFETRPSSSSAGQIPYVRTAYGDRAWKLKSKTHTPGSTLGAPPPSIVISALLPHSADDQGYVSADIAPIHLFVDISLVTRLAPSLRRFASAQIAALKQTTGNDYEMADSVATLAASFATIQASTDSLLHGASRVARQKSSYRADVKVSFVRIDIRTPQISYDAMALAGRPLNSARLSGLDRRSGILVLQMQRLDVQSGLSQKQRSSNAVRFAQSNGEGLRHGDAVVTGLVSVEALSVYLALPSQSRALILAKIEAIQDEAEASSPFATSRASLLPRVQLSRIEDAGADSGLISASQVKDRCSVSIPSIKVELGKAQLDSLQYMADDLTQSIQLWTSDDLNESDSLDAEGLKILGSRFFGSRAGMSVMSASTDSTATARATTRNSSLLLTITEASIRLWLPILMPADESPRESSAKSLLLLTSDFELRFESDNLRNITRIEIQIPQMQLSAESGSASEEISSSLLAFRTMERSLDDRRHDTMLLLVLEAYAEPGTSYREQNVDLTLSAVTLSPSFDRELIPRIKRFLKAPAGVFENVEPNEVTRISFKAKDCSIWVAPPTTTNRAAAAIGEVSVKTKLTSHAPKTSIKLAVGDLDVFATEAEPAETSSNRPAAVKSASEHWSSRKYSRLLHIPETKGSVHLNTLTRPEVDVKITKLRVKLQVAADTLNVVTSLMGAISATDAPATRNTPAASTSQDDELQPLKGTKSQTHDTETGKGAARKPSPMAAHDLDRTAELMSGIEDNAYHLASPLPVAVDLVDDDVPSDAGFLGAKGRYHPEIVETTLDSDEFFGGESVASLSLLGPRTDTVIFADEDVTIRLLDPKGICPVQEYFTDPDLRPQNDSALGATASSVRVRISNFDLSVRLHAGYDWTSTQKAVQREAKLVRKRLQKIKQLLAEGQVPDDSVEAATSHLLDSIHITLPNVPAEMDADAMMQAVEEELGDESDVASTANSDASASWQTLPAARRGQQTQSRGSKASATTEAHQNKLQRSPRSMIDFNFRGLEVEYDKADPSQPGHVVSRIAVNARRFEIIDNIKTSTWRTFLTEMQDRNAALRHNAESKMVKVEIVYVRPQGSALDDANAAEAAEVRMRAKISPLRLHVDQDALDFLKKFFTFKVPGQQAPPPSAQPTGPPLPFVQFAEVLPIKIKLDYKPKRVDYNLLRQGKTIELMNFFHFEGSEMVLRHITLRGINGWARLFDTLNDIWTPDVKANQLADFLSGLGPIRSLVNVGAGLADLVLLPIEQYHKDGRVLRGVQRGATSFAKSTALEAVKLGARLATGTQVILEQAEHILGGELPAALTARAVGPDGAESYESLSESIMVESLTPAAGDNLVSRYATQPDNMRDALSQAYSGLTEGLTSAAQTILAIPMEVYEPDPSTAGAAGGSGGGRPVVKAVPIAILKGARGATQAIAKTMQGVQVSLGDMENVKEGKYKQPARGGR